MNAKKIAIIVGIIVLAGAIVGFTVNQSQKNVVTVQSGKVLKQDISSVVTASGEILPETYVNVGANAMGRITKLYVDEGQKVKKGQVLAQLENVQSEADVNAMKAQIASNETDAVAASAALKTALAQSKSSTATSLAPSSITIALRTFTRTSSLPSRILTPKKPLMKSRKP